MRPWGAAPAVIVIALGLLLSGRGLGVSGEAAVSLPPEAAQVARDFLFAFSRNDRDRIQTMLPKRLENLYGPCPFARMPELRNPRADTRAAAIDFEGPMADTGLPNKGIIMLRLVEEEGRRGWRVRQIYWYQKLPPEAEIPERSATPADRAQEPLVRQAAEDPARRGAAPDAVPVPDAYRSWGLARFFPANVKFVWERLTGKTA